MAQHNNPSIANDSLRILNNKGGEFLSNELSLLTPVVPIVPCCQIVRYVASADATSTTIYTTPSDKDFYLVAVQVSTRATAAAQSTSSSLRVTIDGVVQRVINIAVTPAVARSGITESNSFPFPIKIDRNTAITVNNDDATATVVTTATITGYLVDVTR